MENIHMEPVVLLYLLIAIVVIDNVWDIVLTKRQIIVCQNTIFVPEELRAVIPLEQYHRARLFEIHKCELEVARHFLEIIFSVCELVFGFYPFVWNGSANILKPLTNAEIWISVLFMLFITAYFTVRLVPLILYEKCILEVRYGILRRVSLCALIYIACCGIILSQILIAPLTMLVVLIITSSGYYFNYYIWVAFTIFTIVMLFLTPWCIIPAIGNQERVPEGPLYNELKKVTDATGFPMDRIYIVRTNAQMPYSNAYFCGCLCLKRIVIFDTMLINKGRPVESGMIENGQGLSNQMLAGVVAHELGHWKNGHFYKSMICFNIHFLITMALFGLWFHSPQLYEAVHFEKGVMPIIVGIIISFRFAMVPYMTIANFLRLCITRRYEFQADRFAHKLGYSLQLRGALLKLYIDNMSFPVYDRCYSMWNHTHPTLLQRLHYQQYLDMQNMMRNLRNMQN